MPGHDYTFGCQNEQGEFDIFAKIRDEQSSDNKTTIALMATTQAVAKRITDIMVERGLIAEHEGENGQKMYELTDKGRQLDKQAKQNMLEDLTHE